MVKTQNKGGALTRSKICEYVWAVYIDVTKAPFEIDESEALHFFEKFYSKHPLNEDEECFYYGILLYEQSFSDDANRDRYLVKAKQVFDVYRDGTGETEWEPIEDRYADVCDIIESENLLEKVQTAADLAPEIPGMVMVPAGPFPFGPDSRQIVLEPYYIDIYPVTNAEYRVFLRESKYRRPALWDRNPQAAADEYPVTGVSWMDALQYCKWAKKSLPTVEQWEKAARGNQGHLYPWGDEAPSADRCNYHDLRVSAELLPATRYDAFPSPYGTKAMVGTVWEWTNTNYPDEDGSQYIKGGSWADPANPDYLSTTAYMWASKKEKNDIIGFRCTKALDV